MPFTVITLKNSSPSLRGDLSKWMQEIATGVYVGNFNSRIRENLWSRVQETVGDGEATMSYAYRNEIGYSFLTHNAKREVIDSDGLPLVLLPIDKEVETRERAYGFSKAAKLHQARKFSRKPISSPENRSKKPFVVLEIETDGLDERRNSIIELAALKVTEEGISEYHALIQYQGDLPKEITKLTGIDTSLLRTEGIDLEDALQDLRVFIAGFPLIGYNIRFDIGFLNQAALRLKQPLFRNTVYDLMKYVKKEKPLLTSFQLERVITEYRVGDFVPHRALADAKLILLLAQKVIKFRELMGIE